MSNTICQDNPIIDMAGIAADSIVDGPGIRTAYFAQGCPHHCEGCQNPETWEFGIGTPMDTEHLAGIAFSNPLCKGVTFSGGEPFSQAEGFYALAKKLRSSGYEIACYSGYVYETLRDSGTPEQKALLSCLDVLVDGPFLVSERTLDLAFRGSRNQRIIDVQASLQSGRTVIEESPRWQGDY